MNDQTKERLDRLTELYAEAMRLRLCSSRQEFAALVGVSKQTIYSAMNGSELYLTDKLLARCTKAVHPGVSITMQNSDEAHDNVQKIFEAPAEPAPQNIEDMRAIVHEFTESLREERESHERIMLALIEKIGQN